MNPSARKRIAAIVIAATVSTLGIATGTQPAAAWPRDCQFDPYEGPNGAAFAVCDAGYGLYWVQVSCGTNKFNPTYVRIGRRYSAGSGYWSWANCDVPGANYLISASLHRSDN